MDDDSNYNDIEWNLVRIVPTLSVGHEFKNYKDLCLTLNIAPSSGNSKLKQMKEIERFMVLEKKGHKFIVEKIFTIPREKSIDGRFTYGQDIEFALVQGLYLNARNLDTNDIHIVSTVNTISYNIGMTNKTFVWNKAPTKIEKDSVDLPRSRFNNFHYSVRSMVSERIESVLNRMERNCFLYYNRKLYIAKNYKGRFLTEAEINRYNELVNETVQEMNNYIIPGGKERSVKFKCVSDIIKHGNMAAYNKLLQAKLEDAFEEGCKIFFVYDIYTTKKLIDYATLNLRTKDEIIGRQYTINRKFLKSVEESEYIRKQNSLTIEQQQILARREIEIDGNEFWKHFNSLSNGNLYILLESA